MSFSTMTTRKWTTILLFNETRNYFFLTRKKMPSVVRIYLYIYIYQHGGATVYCTLLADYGIKCFWIAYKWINTVCVMLTVCVYLGPAALFAQQVGVVIRLLPLLLVGVRPHQLPVTQMVDLLPLLLATDALLVPRSGLKHTVLHVNTELLRFAKEAQGSDFKV